MIGVALPFECSTSGSIGQIEQQPTWQATALQH